VIGYDAMSSNTTRSDNTANGFSSLGNNSTGSNIIAIGSGAGSNLTTGSNNIDLYDGGVAGESNTIPIGTEGTQTVRRRHRLPRGFSRAGVRRWNPPTG
jgi:hypothetical protein